MYFCNRCGRPLAAGETCSCSKQTPVFNTDSAQGFVESMKSRMGIGDPELNKCDAYETGKRIIPDCVNASEGEIPVKQYEVATLQNRIFGIPFMKAVGRVQVTNKRVIFRAPGKCLAGRTTLQHEFAIDELAGIDARREYVFNAWDLIIGVIVAILGGIITTTLVTSLCSSAFNNGETAGAAILALLFGIAGCIPFFMIKKKWLLKLLCLGGSFMPLFSIGGTVSLIGEYTDSGASALLGGLLSFLGLISLLFALFALFLYAISPNLVLLIKTTSGSDEAISVKSKNTGYAEIIPAEDAERCIREIDAMISDIQKLGDFGIEKWKV